MLGTSSATRGAFAVPVTRRSTSNRPWPSLSSPAASASRHEPPAATDGGSVALTA